MYDREDVELALYALEEGMTPREAAELVASRRQAITGARRTDPVETAAT